MQHVIHNIVKIFSMGPLRCVALRAYIRASIYLPANIHYHKLTFTCQKETRYTELKSSITFLGIANRPDLLV